METKKTEENRENKDARREKLMDDVFNKFLDSLDIEEIIMLHAIASSVRDNITKCNGRVEAIVIEVPIPKKKSEQM